MSIRPVVLRFPTGGKTVSHRWEKLLSPVGNAFMTGSDLFPFRHLCAERIDAHHIDTEAGCTIGRNDAVGILAIEEVGRDVHEPVVANYHVLQCCGEARCERRHTSFLRSSRSGVEVLIVGLREYRSERVAADILCGHERAAEIDTNSVA